MTRACATRSIGEDRNPILLSPILLSMVQSRLDHISRQMGWVMTRTSRNPIFSQSHDFSCFISDPAGTIVSQADGIPIHTGGGGFAVRAVLEFFDGADDFGGIDDGDVFLVNDPYVGGGNHLPDWVIARPVFAEGRLVGFTCNRAHQSDIGGGSAGAYNPRATEIFHEGLRLPPLKLVERGVTRSDLWNLLLLNCRTPALLDGDIRAMVGSTRIGAERVFALVDELGVDETLDCFTGILDHADTRFRAALAGLPDGRWQAEERVDNDCFEAVDAAIRVTLELEGDCLVVDFSGTDAQIRGFKNSPLANTTSAVYLALASFFDPDLPHNEGAFRNVRIVAPEGTIVHPRQPAPQTMCTVFVAHEIVHAVWKALAQADPERSCAGWGKSVHGNVAGGIGGDAPFVWFHWHVMAGGGATAERDGFNQIGYLIALGGLSLPNVEVYEQLYPGRFVRQEFRCDAAGPGRLRGGTGVDYEVEVQASGEWSFRGEGLEVPSAYGVQGGGWGEPGTMRMEPGDGDGFTPPRYGISHLGPVRLRASSPGGGGWGSPLEREASAVLRDVRDGVVSREAAEQQYGVVLDEAGRSVDEQATARRRRAPVGG